MNLSGAYPAVRNRTGFLLAFYISRCYKNAAIDNGVIDFLKEAEVIANRDHSIDGGITQAAYEEFLSCG